jgi:signal peptidase I
MRDKPPSVSKGESSDAAPAPDSDKKPPFPDSDSGSFNLPDKRPSLALRLLIEHLWLLIVAGLFGLFLLVIHLTNHIDLSFLPAPRLLQGMVAGLVLFVIGMGPYLLFRTQIDWTRQDLVLHRDAEMALKDARRRLARYGERLDAEPRRQVETATEELATALRDGPPRRVNDALVQLDQVLGDHLQFGKKGATREYTESIAVAVFIALLLRAFVVEAFKIPSGSMIPTLQVGDHIFVNKFLFGIRVPWTNIKFFKHAREPERGEIIVFVYPVDPDKDFIKRIVAIPGDTVQVCGGQVLINNQPLRREPVPGHCEYDDYDEEHPTGSWHKVPCVAYHEWNGHQSYTTVHNPITAALSQSCTTPVTVPQEHVFVMGDNRDNSHDSRFWGPVHYDLIKGKAWFIWWSTGEGTSVRLGRIFDRIHH